MASAKSLEEMLSSEVDERAVNAFIQSLDSQLSSNVNLPPQDIVTGGNNYTPKQSTASTDALKHGGLERSTMTTNNSQAFCINNVTSSAVNDNVVVTLAAALPASGYINQVGNTQTQSTVVKNMSVDGNPDMKIYTQGNISQLNSVHISPGNRTVIQRNNIKHANVANGNINIAGQPGATMLIPAGSLKTASQAKNASAHSPMMVSNVTNPVMMHHPVILTEPQCSINGNINQVMSGIHDQKPQINSESILIPYSKQGTNNPICNQDITVVGKGSTPIKTEVGLPLSTSVATPVPMTNTVQSQQHSKPLNVVTQVVSSGSILPGVHILNMCVANSGTAQKTLAPRMGFNTPLRITSSPQVIAARPRATVQNTITLPQGLMRNTLLVRTESGHFQMLNVAPGLTAAGGIPGTTTYRLEAVQPRAQTTVTNSVLQPNQGLNVMASIPPTANVVSSQSHTKKTSASSLSQPLTIQTSTANGQVSSSSSSQQMSPNTAKKKCKNFLSTLIRLASNQPNHVAANVKSLIQRIIDGAITPEEFSHQLQKELNSSPQPYLIPFLKKNLPYLRHSLMTRELSIEGIRPPAPGTVVLPSPQVIQMKAVPPPSQLRVVSPSVLQSTLASSALGQRLVTPRLPGVTGIKTVAGSKCITDVFAQPAKSVLISRPSSSSSSSKDRERDKKNFASLRDDDDINDVAAMGGVNLIEESQRILATNAEIVGTQIRSCKDETFFSSGLLHRRILKIANKFGLDDVSSEVTTLISHAAQERLKTIVEKLGLVVANYVENPKIDPKYEVVSDVKKQIEVLEEVDRLSSKRKERDEVLTDPSKVRLKLGNSEDMILQHREKEESNLEAKHVQTNLTALLAVGPRKRLKTDYPNRLSDNNLLPQNHAHVNQQANKKLKRATLRDLIFVMEQDKEMSHSSLLYKAYTK